MNKELISYFNRYLNQLSKEIKAYTNEADLWKVQGAISNSGGNLCVHLLGNLNHFIGAVIGKTGYVRKRDEEFSIKEVPREEMLVQIEETKRMLAVVLEKADLDAPFPPVFYNEEGTTRYFLYRFMAHLAYHVGQINYHRRLLNN